MANQHHFFAIVLPGLERIAAQELKDLSAHDIHITHGGIRFAGSMQLAYRVNIRSRTITRVLMRLRSFRSMSLTGFRFALEKVAWHLFLDTRSKLAIEVHTHHAKLHHSEAIRACCQEVITKMMPNIGTSAKPLHKQTLHVRIENNRGTLSLDTSGERLDRRGYRLASAKAPMRETLAAAILSWSGWQPEQALLIPMCGAGTLAIEATMIAKGIAPNLNHDFAFLHWPSFKPKMWDKAFTRAKAMRQAHHPMILASDINQGAVQATLNNAKRAGVQDVIEVTQADVLTLTKPTSAHGGVLVLNPPYGARIGSPEPTRLLWQQLGAWVRQHILSDGTWKTIVICPDTTLEKALGLPVSQRLRVIHGGKKVTILQV